jgi:hypothetical protein
MSFKPDAPLDDEDDKPHLAIAIGVPSKKPRSAFKPEAPLDDEEESTDEGDAGERFKESMEIMAKMISAGRVDATRLGSCFKQAFQACEDMPHSENEEGEDKGSEYDKEGN